MGPLETRMRWILGAIAVSFLVRIEAACPNACSGNGRCDINDACICYANFQGGDCSQRVCPYGWAWAAAPNGDLNMDGTLFGATVYADEYRFTASASYLTTDAMPGGTWEWWPSFAASGVDEGHFYMECSNKGLCNRQNGLCQCFPGFEGSSCQRRVCPNDCSGNGICLTVNQLLADYNADNTPLVYNMWDGDMARSCKCDPGYTGADCSQKACPKGDDPLTVTFQNKEVQWIDIYSTLTTRTADLGGQAAFTYTDGFGQKWKTDPVTIQAYGSASNSDDQAAALEAAIEALPNKVAGDVTVTAGHCETVLPNKFLGFDAGAATDQYNGGTNPAGYLHCPDAVASLEQGHLVVLASDQSIYFNEYAGSGSGTYDSNILTSTADNTGSADVTCFQVLYPQCVRFKVVFDTVSGPVADLAVDTTAVTLNGETLSQDNTLAISSTITDELQIVTDSTATFGHYYTPDEEVYSTDDQGTITVATKTITFGTASSSAVIFPINSKITLWCDDVKLGIYTVSAHSDTANPIIVVEAIAAPHAECANTGDGTVKVKKASYYVDTNVDFLNADVTGMALEFSNFADSVEQTVSSVQYDATNGGQIFFDGPLGLAADEAAVNGVATIYGVGTKESSECGDRGLCNRGTGVCQCFRGYSGPACSTQNERAS